MHKEAGLDERKGLTKAYGCVLSYYYRCNAWVLAIMPKYSRAHDRSTTAWSCSWGAWGLTLLLGLWRLNHLLVLDQLLKVTWGEALHMIDDNVIRSHLGIDLDNSFYVIMPALVWLLLLYAIAEVVWALLQLKLGGSLAFTNWSLSHLILAFILLLLFSIWFRRDWLWVRSS